MQNQEFTKIVKNQVISCKNFNKIFCIGYNKTGTSTLEKVLRLYGYRVPNQQEQEIRLVKQVFSTNYQEFLSFVGLYDAFQDMPFSQGLTFVAADALFPNSKFILTERESEIWYSSLVRFMRKISGVDDLFDMSEKDLEEKFKYLYPGYLKSNIQREIEVFKDGSDKSIFNSLYDKNYYISMYKQRNELIKKYFSKSPDKLLVIDVTKEESTIKICKFLNIPTRYAIKMPHENKT